MLFVGILLGLSSFYCCASALLFGGMWIRRGFTWWISSGQAIAIAILLAAMSFWCFLIVYRQAKQQKPRKERMVKDSDDGD